MIFKLLDKLIKYLKSLWKACTDSKREVIQITQNLNEILNSLNRKNNTLTNIVTSDSYLNPINYSGRQRFRIRKKINRRKTTSVAGTASL
jgi:hypothetical protein